MRQTDNFAKCAWKMRAWPLFLNNKLLFFLELRAEDLSRARSSLVYAHACDLIYRSLHEIQ